MNNNNNNNNNNDDDDDDDINYLYTIKNYSRADEVVLKHKIPSKSVKTIILICRLYWRTSLAIWARFVERFSRKRVHSPFMSKILSVTPVE